MRSIAWWEASVTLASFINRYEEHGGGDLHSFSWAWDDAPPYAHTGEVETLDGFLLVLSPWAVREIRFDEGLGEFHGYDLDFCLQVREAGRKVVTADLRAIHHRPLQMVPDPERWVAAHVAVAEKWDGRMPGIGTGPGSWRERALRAEAERDLALAIVHWKALEETARTAAARHAIAETRGSLSWRLTAPLRRLSRAAALIAFGSCIVDPDGVHPLRATGDPGRRGARRDGVRVRGRRHGLPQQQPAARRRGGARRPRGARARRRARRARRPGAVRDVRGGVRATRTSRSSAAIGAAGVRSIAWWEGRISRGPVRQRHHDHGGGEVAAHGWAPIDAPPADGRHRRRPR